MADGVDEVAGGADAFCLDVLRDVDDAPAGDFERFFFFLLLLNTAAATAARLVEVVEDESVVVDVGIVVGASTGDVNIRDRIVFRFFAYP